MTTHAITGGRDRGGRLVAAATLCTFLLGLAVGGVAVGTWRTGAGTTGPVASAPSVPGAEPAPGLGGTGRMTTEEYPEMVLPAHVSPTERTGAAGADALTRQLEALTAESLGISFAP